MSKRERPSVAEALTWLRAEIVRRDRAHTDKAAARADHDLACLKAVARVVETAGKDARTLAATCVSQIRHYEIGEGERPRFLLSLAEAEAGLADVLETFARARSSRSGQTE